MTARSFIGAGDLYMARQVNGVFEDWKGPFECTKFEIKPNVDLKEKTSRGKLTYGQVIASVALAKPADFTVNLGELDKEGLVSALLGTSAALAQASGTMTEEVFVAPALGTWKPLSKRNLTGSQTVTNSAEDTTYVEGTDYKVNKTLGWIMPIEGGAITAAQSLKVTSTYGAVEGTTIKGATQAQIRAKFKLDGVNFVDGLPVIVEVYQGVIAAQSAIDFLSDNFAELALPGRMETPVGKTEPFIVELIEA